MSRENVEIVQSAYRAINDADDDAALSLCANDVEIDASGRLSDLKILRSATQPT